MKADETDVLEMLIRHELVIKELYEVFAAMFKSYQDFWNGLAGDERRHADKLGTLRSDPAIHRWLLRESRLRPRAIKSSIEYVEQQIKKAQEGNLKLLQTLSIARDLESALLEKQFSKFSDTASEEIKSTLKDLVAETEGHRKTLVKIIEAEKR